MERSATAQGAGVFLRKMRPGVKLFEAMKFIKQCAPKRCTRGLAKRGSSSGGDAPHVLFR